MIEVHLIGYTADLRHLVLDLDDGATGRYRLVVDADLFATVDQLRDERRVAGLPVGDPEEFLTPEELAAVADVQATDADEPDADEPEADGPGRESPGMWRRDDVLFGPGDEEDEAEVAEPAPVRTSDDVRLGTPAPFPPGPDPGPDPEPEPAAVEPKLTPAQIQSLLRAGRSPRAVAREAGTDVAWIERWLPPIMAERTRILDRAQAKRLERPRLGRSRDALGQAVPRNLAAKGVDTADLVWEAARRKDGRWKVSVRFPQRDRVRTATWTYDPSDDELKPASDLAHELGFSRTKDTAGETGTPAKKVTAKKGTAKQAAAKKATAKKAAAKQAAAKKATAKKAAARTTTETTGGSGRSPDRRSTSS